MNQGVDVMFYDVYGFYYVPFWKQPWFVWSCGIFLACACLCIIYLVLRRRVRTVSPQMSWQWAEERLAELRPSAVRSREEVRHFYFELICVLKQYLSRRFGRAFEDKTDDELLAMLRATDFIKGETFEELSRILVASVESRFARGESQLRQVQDDWSRAVKVIRTTIPITDVTKTS